MNWMNVFSHSWRPRYYLAHPWRFIQEVWYNIRDAWHRATRGYCYRDAADMDEYLLHSIPALLREVAEGPAYPGTKPFETYEKWQDFCNSLADVFEAVQEENWSEGHNEWQEEWEKAFDVLHPHPNITITQDMTEEEAREVCSLYWEREKELRKEREGIIQDAYATLAKYHDYFWI